MKVLLNAAGFLFFYLLSAAVYTVSREANKAPVNIEDLITDLSDLVLGIDEDELTTNAPCLLNIQNDLPKPNEPQPLYIKPNTNQFWLPNSNGVLEIPHGASIELYCSKYFANITVDDTTTQKIPSNVHTIRPTCLSGSTFALWGEKYKFSHFKCTQPVKFCVEQLGERCATNTAQMYRVGFNITNRRFIETMRICHDDDTLRTHYTQYVLQPANLNYQRFVKRMKFSKAGFFTQHNMDFLYTQQNQHKQAKIASLYGDTLGRLFDNQTLFLARGHLAAKADMIYANQQRTTFNFFNVAPQWQSFNGGQWATLEDKLRKFIANSQLVVVTYTGTVGVLELPSYPEGIKRPFYLSYDANNNDILPVPQLFYRVIVDCKQQNRGIALVGVNNPFVDLDEINESYLICDDIHEEIPWLRWIRNTNLKRGYLYACKVNDFAKAVKHLPTELNAVDEVLL